MTSSRTRARMGGIHAAWMSLALCLALSGCSRDGADRGQEENAPTPAWAYQKTIGDGGPVGFTLRLEKTEAGLADRILLEQELRVKEGFEADFPEYLPEDFEGLAVVDISTAEALSPAGAPAAAAAASPSSAAAAQGAPPGNQPPMSVRTKRLVLEPERSGDLAVAPLAVYFHPKGEAQESSFLTEEVPIHVKPLEDAGALALRPLRGIYETPPAPPSYRGLVAAVVAALLLAVVVGGLLLWRRRPRKAPRPVPPHEIAYEALRRLLALQLIEKGEIELFFVILSAILRDYIESRFQVRAPERTTEEFLAEAARDPALSQHRARLAEFLALCDQVKFARFQPDDAAIQGAFDTLKRFLSETTPHES